LVSGLEAKNTIALDKSFGEFKVSLKDPFNLSFNLFNVSNPSSASSI